MLSKITLKNHSTVISIIAKIIDILLYFFAAVAAYYQQFDCLYFLPTYRTAILIAIILIVPIFSLFKVYDSLRGRDVSAYFRAILPAIGTLMITLAALAFITKTGEGFSRYWFILWHAYAITILIAFRIGLRWLLKLMREKGHNHKRIIIIGISSITIELVTRINNSIWSGFDITAIFTDKKVRKNIEPINPTLISKIPKNLSQYITEQNIDEVWIMASAEDSKRLEKIATTLRYNVVNIRYFPAIFTLELLNHSISEIFGLPVMNIISSPMAGINQLVKIIEDIVLSSLILLIISPLFLAISLLVKFTSPGPVFYKQKRVGWNGKEFNILKFRSMPINAENKTGAVWATATDSRPTKIGAFLRKTSLDELPQFINVLKGEMSIVGPRPERHVFVEQFKKQIPNYMKKHLVKAGITGWAQVNGWRGNTSLEKRIEYDIYYINHWSLWLDIKIIFLTIFKGFVNKNAY